jgi:Ti-type conjugative transfer relaxase TraA
MAICFVGVKFIKRSEGRNAVMKAAYIDRADYFFEGNCILASRTFDFSWKEKPEHSGVVLPNGANEKFLNPQILWNAIEQFEKRKDSQVGKEYVLALPDDECVTLEDKIELVRRYIKIVCTDRGYGAHYAIHQGESRKLSELDEDFEYENASRNSHAHIMEVSREFDESGESFSKKNRNKLPQVRKGLVVDASDNVATWVHVQNSFFEEKGWDLRVDPPGIIKQKHLGPRRLRGEKGIHGLIENDSVKDQNKRLMNDPNVLLQALTEKQSVFTEEDVGRMMSFEGTHEEIEKRISNFWNNPKLVQLYAKDSPEQPVPKFTSQQAYDEERKIVRLAERLHEKNSHKLSKKVDLESFKKGLTSEQKQAFDYVVSGKRISNIVGDAGTGKSHLLVSLRDLYESAGYSVKAFGPDNRTAEVLKSKGFEDATNIYSKLWKHRHKKLTVKSGKEVWLIDEAGKLGNRALLELLKLAEKNDVQLCFTGDPKQLESVERGGMFGYFCKQFPSARLTEILRQNRLTDREIGKKLATNDEEKIREAVDLINLQGGFIWESGSSNGPHECSRMISQWIQDRRHFPGDTQLMISLKNEDVRFLNDEAHKYLISCGEVANDEFECHTPYGVIYVSENDQILFRQNDYKIGVTNGQRGILVKASEKEFRVKIQSESGEKEVRFNPSEYCAFQLGYAMSVFSAQGETIDRCYVKYHKHNYQALFYVSATRHIRYMQVFVSNKEADSIARIKKQVARNRQKDITLNYTSLPEIQTLAEKDKLNLERENLKKSDSLIANLKGSWMDIKESISGYREKITDRWSDKEFYKVREEQATGGRVIAHRHRELCSENRGIRFEMIASNKASNQVGESPLKPSAEEPKKSVGIEKSLQDKVETKYKHSPRNLGVLTESEKTAFNNYLKNCDFASELYSIVKAETVENRIGEMKATTHTDWQKACGDRNASALALYRAVDREKIKQVLGTKSYDILHDQAQRHEQFLKPKINIEDQLKDNLEAVLHKLFPNGPSGKDATGLRFGRNKSLAVICRGEKKGCFKDFETGDGGGIVKLIEKQLQCSRSEALSWGQSLLGGDRSGFVPHKYYSAKTELPEPTLWTSAIAPKDNQSPSLFQVSPYLDSKYHLIAKHAYYDKSNNLAMYVLRLEPKGGGKKAIFPLSYGYENDVKIQPKWGIKKYQFEGKIPLYNSFALQGNQQKTVLIVEGEKAADAGAKLFGDNIITVSWLGGSASVKNSDWGMLCGRNIVIWPDNDPAGFKASDEICSCLKRVGVGSLKVVSQQILKDFPEKWDVADTLPEGKEIGFLKEWIQRAEQKAVGLDKLSSLLALHGTNGANKYEVLQLNEILARVDDRLRPQLENEFGSKVWEIENKILAEVSEIIGEKTSIAALAKNIVGHSDLRTAISHQGMVFHARTGESPTLEHLTEIKKAMTEVYTLIGKNPISGASAHNFALEKTCTARIEEPVINSAALKNHYKANLEQVAKVDQQSVKAMRKEREIVISNM